MGTRNDHPRTLLIRALEADDVVSIEALIRDHSELLNALNVRPAVTAARTVATAERLLSLGAESMVREAVGALPRVNRCMFHSTRASRSAGTFSAAPGARLGRC